MSNFAIQYRPRVLEDFIADDDIVDRVNEIIENPPSVLLISGEAGSGKTTVALIIAYAIAGLEYGTKTPDVTDPPVNMASCGIDAVREMVEVMKYAPLTGNRRVRILDEIHATTAAAKKALLTPLESESRNVWIFCTNHPEGLDQTFLGRCVRLHIPQYSSRDLFDICKGVIQAEKITKFLPWKTTGVPSLKTLVSRVRYPREALALLQAVSYSKRPIDEAINIAAREIPEVKVYAVAEDILFSTLRALMDGNPVINKDAQISLFEYLENGGDPRRLMVTLLDFSFNLVRFASTGEITASVSKNVINYVESLKKDDLPDLWLSANDIHTALCNAKSAWEDYKVPPESLLLRALSF